MFDLTMLMQFAEFEEEDGSPVAVCDPGCGETRCMSTEEVEKRIITLDPYCVWMEPMWVFMESALWCAVADGAFDEYAENYPWMLDVLHCPKCGALVGRSADGTPYRIRLSRIVEALERSQAAIRIMEDGLREDAMMSNVRNAQHATLRRMCEYADEFDTEELQEHGDVLRDATRALLAAVEAVPDAKHRFAEWCGENFAAIWYEFSLLRDELGLPQPECDEEASGSDPAPDFDAMDPDNLSLVEVQALRDWLDERGRRCVWEFPDGWLAELTRRGESSGERIGRVHEVQPSEPAVLLALCKAVAAEEAS